MLETSVSLLSRSTGYGDGFYPVKATFNEEGRVASVTVTFIEDDYDA